MDKFVIITKPKARDSNGTARPNVTPSTSDVATDAGNAAASQTPVSLAPAPGPGAEDNAKRKRDKTRKYSEMYLKFGFTFKETEGVELPVCVVCAATLSNESMKPSKLQRHFEKNHGHLQGKPLDYFQNRLQSLQGQQTMMRKSAKVGELALKASYQVALRVAQCKKPYTIAEQLILPAAADMCRTMLGNDECANKLKTVPLSDTTIARRIVDLASDVRVQLIEKLQTAEGFALQLDESVDVSKDAQLLAFVRFADEKEMCEEFLFCKTLPERTTSAEIFKVIDDFFRENEISWAKCVAVCTDGARAMTGQKSGLMMLVKKVAPKVIWTHCMLHRESLATKEMSADFADVMDTVVKAVNCIKKSALQTRLFASLCDATREEHNTLLYHSEVRWLSRGSVLARVFELRTAIHDFLVSQKREELAAPFSDGVWVTKLAYLADIFAELNRLNSSMQGRNAHAIQLYDKLEGFLKKTKRWREQVRGDNISRFPSVEELADAAVLSPDVKCAIIHHLEALESQFERYFSEAESWRKDKTWIQFPFKENACDGSNLTAVEEDQLIDLSTDSVHKNVYESKPLPQFWIHCQPYCPQLSAKAMLSLLPFATTYLCESGFSSLTYLKSKYRSRLQPEDDMMLCLTTSISPRIDKLCATHQGQSSH